MPQVIHDTENTLVSLALDVAQKLVSDMPISVPMIEATVRDALAQIEGTAQFTVRLHPADLELLKRPVPPCWHPPTARNFASWVRPRSPAAGASSKPGSGPWTAGAKPNLTS